MYIRKNKSNQFFLSLLVFDSWALFPSERNAIYYIIVLYIVYNH